MKVGNQKRKIAFEEEGACFNDINFINITITPPYLHTQQYGISLGNPLINDFMV